MKEWIKSSLVGCAAGVFVFVALGSSEAIAASCSAFAVIKSYDADANMVELEYSKKGNVRKYFPRVEGSTGSKIPGKCRRRVTKVTQLVVKPTGGRMSITQFRSNLAGRMLNDVEDKTWVGTNMQQLIDGKTQVCVVIRPGMGKDAPLGITTIYMPITPEEEAEIQRRNDEASDA